MEEIRSVEEYRRVARELSQTEAGSAILRGEAKEYPLGLFQDDLDKAIENAGLDYVRVRLFWNLAVESAKVGGGMPSVDKAVQRACQRWVVGT